MVNIPKGVDDGSRIRLSGEGEAGLNGGQQGDLYIFVTLKRHALFIREDENFEDILYAGLYRGLYVSLDRGKSWNILGKNLPMSSVSDMEVHKSTNDMIISTHGRGIYKFNLNPLHKYYLKQENISDELLFSDNDRYIVAFARGILPSGIPVLLKESYVALAMIIAFGFANPISSDALIINLLAINNGSSPFFNILAK